MVTQGRSDRHAGPLDNETVVNVASLLQDDLGSRREFEVHLDSLALSNDLVATDLDGHVELTRLRDQVLADVALDTRVQLECVRCLRPYDQPVAVAFSEPFVQKVDVRSGAVLPDSEQTADDDEEVFEIDDHHEIDLREAIRQNILLELPMRPDCGENCPGPDTAALASANQQDSENVVGDERLSALSKLLGDDQRS